MIRLESVRFRYEDMEMRFDARFPAGSFTAVIGPSGAGKSTLLNLIAGFERPLSGRILIGGQDMTQTPPALRPVSMIFQDNNVFAHLSVRNNVAIGLSPGLKLDAGQSAQVDGVLAQTGIAGLAQRKPSEISGGERQRIAIARALLRDRPILLLDEPFAALGPALRDDMLNLLTTLQKDRRLTVLMVTHQPEDAKQGADFTAFVDHGEIIALRPTAELLASTDVPGLDAYLGALEPTRPMR
jgi:thiamine transport system ATP-binding protein